MDTPLRPTVLTSSRRLLSLLMLGAAIFCSAEIRAQSNVPPPPADATATFEAVFDAGIVYQPSAGEFGITELMIAVLNSDAAQARSLIEAGADVNARDDSGATALIGAVAYGQAEIVNLLLAAGADANISDQRGDLPLGMAVKYKNIDAALALLQHGANPNVYLSPNDPRSRRSVMQNASVTGQVAVVSALIARGVDLKSSGPAALYAAIHQGHEKIAFALIASGVDVNASPYDPAKTTHSQVAERPLHMAARAGRVSTVELLLRHGADVHASNQRGQTALSHTTRDGHLAVAKVLLAHGALVSVSDLSTALGTKQIELSRLLLQSVDLTSLSAAEHDTLLAVADAAGDETIIAALIDAENQLRPAPHAPLFLFARRDAADCQITVWNPDNSAEHIVYTEQGICTSQFYFSKKQQVLIVVSGDRAEIIALHGNDPPQSVALPRQQIEANLAVLKQRVQNSYGRNAGNAQEWMSARIVKTGYLDSGELALVTHTGGPADETYGYVYARIGANWQVVEQTNCHRFDACMFPQVRGLPLGARPGRLAIWHPDQRKNPYFQSKTEDFTPQDNYAWNGAVTFNIDGEPSVIHYGKEESGHCSGDCVYTRGLSLQLPGRDEIELSPYAGNSTIVGRYALVAVKPGGDARLVDLATGESVFGDLQVAGWVY